jgi:hypothetical protein
VGGGDTKQHKNRCKIPILSIGYIFILLLVVGSIPRFNFFSIAMSDFDWPMKPKKKKKKGFETLDTHIGNIFENSFGT